MNFPNPKQFAAIKAALLAACLIPLALLAYGAANDTLGANPIEAIIRGLGDWALRFLLLTLAVTPLRRLTGWNQLVKLRRLLGLYAFFYALLHLLGYVWADQFFDWMGIADDVIKHPFITVGFLSFVLLVPLAVTSTNTMIKRLGGRRWQLLHRLVYPIAILGVLHYWWMVKADITQPAIHAVILSALFGLRILGSWRGTAYNTANILAK